MNLIDYQKWTLSTAVYPDAGKHTFNEMVYLTLGLSNEAGEFAGRIKKVIRGDNVDPETVLSEAGDVLWYLTRICDNLGIALEDVAEYNYQKLMKAIKEDIAQSRQEIKQVRDDVNEGFGKIEKT